MEYEEIRKWLLDHNIINFYINEDLSVDVKTTVNLYGYCFDELPFQFGRVVGGFICLYNGLRSLKGCPNEVWGDFDCSHNQLTSLEYCPQKVKGNFYCINNKLPSLEYSPKKIGSSFNCSGNLIKDLSFCPGIIKKNLDCRDNLINKENLFFFNSTIFGEVISDFGDNDDFYNMVDIAKKIKLENDFLLSSIKKEDLVNKKNKRI